MPLSNIYNFLKYYPIFLQNILNRPPYLCPHPHIKIYLVFTPFHPKSLIEKPSGAKNTKTYSTSKNYDANIYHFQTSTTLSNINQSCCASLLPKLWKIQTSNLTTFNFIFIIKNSINLKIKSPWGTFDGLPGAFFDFDQIIEYFEYNLFRSTVEHLNHSLHFLSPSPYSFPSVAQPSLVSWVSRNPTNLDFIKTYPSLYRIYRMIIHKRTPTISNSLLCPCSPPSYPIPVSSSPSLLISQ